MPKELPDRRRLTKPLHVVRHRGWAGWKPPSLYRAGPRTQPLAIRRSLQRLCGASRNPAAMRLKTPFRYSALRIPFRRLNRSAAALNSPTPTRADDEELSPRLGADPL